MQAEVSELNTPRELQAPTVTEDDRNVVVGARVLQPKAGHPSPVISTSEPKRKRSKLDAGDRDVTFITSSTDIARIRLALAGQTSVALAVAVYPSTSITHLALVWETDGRSAGNFVFPLVPLSRQDFLCEIVSRVEVSKYVCGASQIRLIQQAIAGDGALPELRSFVDIGVVAAVLSDWPESRLQLCRSDIPSAICTSLGDVTASVRPLMDNSETEFARTLCNEARNIRSAMSLLLREVGSVCQARFWETVSERANQMWTEYEGSQQPTQMQTDVEETAAAAVLSGLSRELSPPQQPGKKPLALSLSFPIPLEQRFIASFDGCYTPNYTTKLADAIDIAADLEVLHGNTAQMVAVLPTWLANLVKITARSNGHSEHDVTSISVQRGRPLCIRFRGSADASVYWIPEGTAGPVNATRITEMIWSIKEEMHKVDPFAGHPAFVSIPDSLCRVIPTYESNQVISGLVFNAPLPFSALPRMLSDVVAAALDSANPKNLLVLCADEGISAAFLREVCKSVTPLHRPTVLIDTHGIIGGESGKFLGPAVQRLLPRDPSDQTHMIDSSARDYGAQTVIVADVATRDDVYFIRKLARAKVSLIVACAVSGLAAVIPDSQLRSLVGSVCRSVNGQLVRDGPCPFDMSVRFSAETVADVVSDLPEAVDAMCLGCRDDKPFCSSHGALCERRYLCGASGAFAASGKLASLVCAL